MAVREIDAQTVGVSGDRSRDAAQHPSLIVVFQILEVKRHLPSVPTCRNQHGMRLLLYNAVNVAIIRIQRPRYKGPLEGADQFFRPELKHDVLFFGVQAKIFLRVQMSLECIATHFASEVEYC